MEKVYARTKGIRDDMVSGFCPGCMHSTRRQAHRRGARGDAHCSIRPPVPWASAAAACTWTTSHTTTSSAAHGRACAVATGAKRCETRRRWCSPIRATATWLPSALPRRFTLPTAARTSPSSSSTTRIYGMTGGQMAPTTLVGMKATTAPFGRDPKEHGYPMHVCEILQPARRRPYYLERTSCNIPRERAQDQGRHQEGLPEPARRQGLLPRGDRHQLSDELGSGRRSTRWTIWRTRCSRSSRSA